MNIPDSTKIAAVRALLTATVLGAIAGLTMWQATDSPKDIIIAVGLSFLGVIGARLGIEGYIDRPKP